MDMFGTIVQARLFAVNDVEAELGGDDDPVAERRNRLADHLFVGEGTIDFGRVEESGAALKRGADQRHTLLLADFGGVAEIQPHTTKADCRNLKIAFSEYAFLHDPSLQCCVFRVLQSKLTPLWTASRQTAKAIAATAASADARKTGPSPNRPAINPKAGVPKPSATSKKAVYMPITRPRLCGGAWRTASTPSAG